MRLHAYPRTRLETFVSREHGSCVYLWGRPAHASVSSFDLPAWCAEIVARKRFDCFRELLGTFAAIVDEPQDGRITMVSDILGIRPMFVGRRDGRYVFGSDVWALHQAGASGGDCNYDAVSTWLAYGYNCTDGSLFSDLRRLAPGAATVLQDGRMEEIPYATLEVGDRIASVEQAAGDLHDIVAADVRILIAGQKDITVALSGGFDSRYLLALCVSAGADLGRVICGDFPRRRGKSRIRWREPFACPSRPSLSPPLSGISTTTFIISRPTVFRSRSSSPTV